MIFFYENSGEGIGHSFKSWEIKRRLSVKFDLSLYNRKKKTYKCENVLCEALLNIEKRERGRREEVAGGRESGRDKEQICITTSRTRL